MVTIDRWSFYTSGLYDRFHCIYIYIYIYIYLTDSQFIVLCIVFIYLCMYEYI